MFCRNCGTDVTNMKYCPNCGTRVGRENKKTMNTANWKPLTTKDYYANYTLACCITTLWYFTWAWLHYFNTVEKYDGAGLEYIGNRAMGNIIGMFIGIAIVSFSKKIIIINLRKIVTTIICAITTQIVTVIIAVIIVFIMIVPDIVHLPYSDIEIFERLRRYLIILFVIVSAICLLCFYMFYTQKRSKTRTDKQEYQSAVFLTSILGVLETLVILVLR